MGVKMDSRGVKDKGGGEVTSLDFGVLCVSKAENPRRALLSELDRINIVNQSNLLVKWGFTIHYFEYVSVRTKRKYKEKCVSITTL